METCRIFFWEICSHIMKQACLPCLPNTVQTCSDSLRRNKQKFIKVFWLQLTLLTFLRSTVCCWSGWPSEVSHSNGAKAPATRDKDVDEDGWMTRMKTEEKWRKQQFESLCPIRAPSFRCLMTCRQRSHSSAAFCQKGCKASIFVQCSHTSWKHLKASDSPVSARPSSLQNLT